MSDLVAFLRSCLDDDEQAAQAAQRELDEKQSGGYGSERRWAVDPTATLAVWLGGEDWCCVGEGIAAHIAAHSPKRVLAEVEAKRQILEELERELADDPENQTALYFLRVLTIPYRDRPGYDPAWSER